MFVTLLRTRGPVVIIGDQAGKEINDDELSLGGGFGGASAGARAQVAAALLGLYGVRHTGVSTLMGTAILDPHARVQNQAAVVGSGRCGGKRQCGAPLMSGTKSSTVGCGLAGVAALGQRPK